jgi:hypothetical protein
MGSLFCQEISLFGSPNFPACEGREFARNRLIQLAKGFALDIPR